MKGSVFSLLDRHAGSDGSPPAMLERFLRHAGLADGLGLEALWLAEHHDGHIGGAPNPAVILAAVAARTARLRLGPSVSVLPYRAPRFVAEDYGLVDRLSGGRLNLGVGSGSQETEYAALGCDFRTRREIFERNLDALLELWPRHADHPPRIYVATTDPDRSRVIGERGHSVITLLPPGAGDLEPVRRQIEAHRDGLRGGGHRPGAGEVVVAQLAHAGTTASEAQRRAVPAIGHLLEQLAPGSPDPGAIYESMVAGATACFGSPAQVSAALRAQASAGVSHVAFISRFGGLDWDAADASLRLLADALDRLRG